MQKIFIHSFMLLGLAVAIQACNSKAENKTKDEGAAVAVKLSPVKEESLARPVYSSGLISTSTEARLSFKIGGIIENIYVKEGQAVKKGQLLASLNRTEIQAQLSQAKFNVEKLSRDMVRVKKLYADSAATLEQWQNIQTAFSVAQDQLAIAEFNNKYAAIQATTNGKVIRKLANEGESIGGGTPVLMINAADDNAWIIKLGLPDADWAVIKMGDKAKVILDAYSNDTLNAEVSLVGEGADPMNGLYLVELKINANGQRLANGLFGKVLIYPNSKQTLKAIPVEAIVEGRGKSANVYIADSNKKSVKKIPIKIQYLEGDKAYVSKGLEGIDNVITSGSAFLTEHSNIMIVE